MIIERPPIRIEEYKREDPNKVVKMIAQASFKAKQYWFGDSKERLNKLDLLELVAEGFGMLDLGRGVKRAYDGLSDFFKNEVRGLYHDFGHYNRLSSERLNETISDNFGE